MHSVGHLYGAAVPSLFSFEVGRKNGSRKGEIWFLLVSLGALVDAHIELCRSFLQAELICEQLCRSVVVS